MFVRPRLAGVARRHQTNVDGPGDRPTCLRLCTSATLIAINWSIFIWGIAYHVVEISLGYFIAPLLNVALGVVCFASG